MIEERAVAWYGFNKTRTEMLKAFSHLAHADPELAAAEAEATLSAMRQLFQLETAG